MEIHERRVGDSWEDVVAGLRESHARVREVITSYALSVTHQPRRLGRELPAEVASGLGWRLGPGSAEQRLPSPWVTGRSSGAGFVISPWDGVERRMLRRLTLGAGRVTEQDPE